MAAKLLLLLVLAAAPLQTQGATATLGFGKNPVRKIVNLLQAMQKKVEEEGMKEKELYDKFMCYCQTGIKDLSESIAYAESKGPSVGSAVEAGAGKLDQAKADLRQAQADRTAADEAMAQAKALRQKEAAAFAAEKAEAEANIKAVGEAIAALQKGAGASFVQTHDAQVLRAWTVNSEDLTETEQAVLVAFLSQGSEEAAPSDEIVGILKTLSESMTTALADSTATEKEARATYEGLIQAKTREKEVLTATIEAKTEQIGELGVSIVQMKNDLADTGGTLEEDKKFLEELKKTCAAKTGEWELRSKTRAEELVAIADTIKTLNEDDALDLFKQTLPSAGASSFMQVQVSMSSVRARAMAAVHDARKTANENDRTQLDLLALALAGKKALTNGGFDKAIAMIDSMVAILRKDQKDDDAKKDYCTAEFDTANDKKTELERGVSDVQTAIGTTEEGIKAVAQEIAALEAGIKELDKSVADATVQRKAENAEFKGLMASNTAAKELLAVAKNRLNKFYNPKLYKPEATPEAAMLVQVGMHTQRARGREAPPPPPETFGAYTKKTEEGSGVISMIDVLIRDLDKETAEAEANEKDAQADYEKLMTDAAAKRTADAKSITEKSAAKADMETDLEGHKAARNGVVEELGAINGYISSLHADCDWLLQNYDARKGGRKGEEDALVKAKAVLNGADYSLLQVASRRFLSRAHS